MPPVQIEISKDCNLAILTLICQCIYSDGFFDEATYALSPRDGFKNTQYPSEKNRLDPCSTSSTLFFPSENSKLMESQP